MRTLVTGAAGFIGFHVCRALLARGEEVLGVDNLNDYYDVSLKEARLAELRPAPGFEFLKLDLVDRAAVANLLEKERPERVLHLAAQAGVRYSLENPHAYVDANLVGFMNLLESCRQHPPEHFVFASSSSVYGANTKVPFAVQDEVNHPVSLYAATKKANELLAHSYSHLFGLPTTGLRFFTVYGPWGRPDMAVYKFTRAILEGRPIEVYNHGQMKRSFTYVDDITEGVVRVLDQPAEPNPGWSGMTPDAGSSFAPYRIYNIGNQDSVELSRMIEILEGNLGRPAEKVLLPAPPGDVLVTSADVSDLEQAVGYHPETSIEDGLRRFVDWYRSYYEV